MSIIGDILKDRYIVYDVIEDDSAQSKVLLVTDTKANSEK